MLLYIKSCDPSVQFLYVGSHANAYCLCRQYAMHVQDLAAYKTVVLACSWQSTVQRIDCNHIDTKQMSLMKSVDLR